MPRGRAAVLAAGAAPPPIEPRIRDFVTDDRARGGVLVASIQAFAEAGLDLRAAAERLEIHPNRAQYRLSRIERRTGCNPRRVEDLAGLLAAIAFDE